MDEMKLIIERIKELREALNFSYQDLANKTGLSKSTLQRYETGAIGAIPLDRLEELAKGLLTSPAYIMGWDTNELTEDELDKARKELTEIIEKTKNGFYFWRDVQERTPNVLSFRIFALSNDEETMILTGHPTYLRIQRDEREVLEINHPKLYKELSDLRRAIVDQIDNRAKPQLPATIAAHALNDLTDEQIGEVMNFIGYLKSKKKKK